MDRYAILERGPSDFLQTCTVPRSLTDSFERILRKRDKSL
jgi:hypothetical protein